MALVRYPGGKSNISKWIVHQFPKHKVYVEVFGGAASVLLSKPSISGPEVYNDVWGSICCVIRQVRDRPLELQNALWSLDLTPETYVAQRKIATGDKQHNELELAAATLYALHNSYSGKVWGNWVPKPEWLAKERELCKDYLSMIDRIPRHSLRLRDVIIENLDFRDVISKYDSPDSLFYVDPPYKAKGKDFDYYGPFDFQFDDHIELAEILDEIQGKAVVSYYPHVRLKKWYQNWRWVERKVKKGMTLCYGTERPEGTEMLMMNFHHNRLAEAFK